jgi:hypothetical protein
MCTMKSLPRLAVICLGFVIVWCFGYFVGKGRQQHSLEGNHGRTDTAHAQSDSRSVSPNPLASLVQAPGEFRRQSNLTSYATPAITTKKVIDLTAFSGQGNTDYEHGQSPAVQMEVVQQRRDESGHAARLVIANNTLNSLTLRGQIDTEGVFFPDCELQAASGQHGAWAAMQSEKPSAETRQVPPMSRQEFPLQFAPDRIAKLKLSDGRLVRLRCGEFVSVVFSLL